MSSPVLLEEGTPVVQAPASVLLKTADQWKGHIVAQFHGLIPHPNKIFNDLNPAWGKFGKIVIRVVSDTSCLIMIPCVSTREWVLQVGYWQAGNCAFSVFPWSVDASLELQELATAPTWAVLHNVPPQMYSLDGISVIASAIGEPLHTEKSRLDPFNFGNTKVKVEISLDKPPPVTIIVLDSQQNSVKVNVSYPRLPPKCCNCDRFGHLLNRCPRPLMKKKGSTGVKEGFAPAGSTGVVTQIPLGKGVSRKQEWRAVSGNAQSSHLVPPSVSEESHKRTKIRAASRKRSKVRSRSTPPVHQVDEHQMDLTMSKSTQEAVKDWIKEREERKLLVLQENVKGTVSEVVSKENEEVASDAPWTFVGPRKKGKGKVGQATGARKQIPGVMSVRKLAKLESKILFSNKKLADAAQAKLSGPAKYITSSNPTTSSSQPNRGNPSVRAT